jgi:hypothetical protein
MCGASSYTPQDSKLWWISGIIPRESPNRLGGGASRNSSNEFQNFISKGFDEYSEDDCDAKPLDVKTNRISNLYLEDPFTSLWSKASFESR